MTKFAVALINFYQVFLSFDRGFLRLLAPIGACRYEISCSQYSKNAIIEFGLVKGSLLGLKRILSCNPFI